MKKWKIVLVAVALVGLVVPLFSCRTGSAGATSGSQTYTVKSGDISTTITAAGNLALARTEDLPFDLFYGNSQQTLATVGTVLVQAGDNVKKGQTLATVDADQWQTQLTTLEVALATAQRGLVQAQLNLVSAQQAEQDAEAQHVWTSDIYAAQAKVYSAQADVDQAQAVLQGNSLIYDRNTGNYRYQQALTPDDIRVWTNKLSTAQDTLASARLALSKLLQESTAEAKEANAQETLKEAQAELDSLLAQSKVEQAQSEQRITLNSQNATSPTVADQITTQQEKVLLAQQQLQNAQKDRLQVQSAKLQVQLSQGKLDDAQRALGDAQKNLDDAKARSPLVVAPFDGFVTVVNVKGGDTIKNGTIAMTVADPTQFEAQIMVSEIDISKVFLSQRATVQVASLTGMIFSANVTQITPTATIQSSVVNYQVTVGLNPVPVTFQQRSPVSGNVSSNSTFQRPPSSGNFSSGNTSTSRPRVGGNFTAGQQATATTQSVQLRQGQTVTVSIIVSQATNVLTVPTSAISLTGGQSYVQVLSGGTTQQRPITTGASNYQYTEVTSGLSEGEQITYQQVARSTATATSTSQNRPGGVPGGFFIR